MTWPLLQVARDAEVARLAAMNRRPDGVTPISPVPGIRPGFAFGAHPSNPNIRYANPQNRHTGVDFPGPEGAPVECLEPGKVIEARWAGAYGWRILIRGGRSGRIWAYCHLSRMDVAEGETARLGQVIGRVGHTSSGYLSGPHLHLELSAGPLWRYNDVVDPLSGW